MALESRKKYLQYKKAQKLGIPVSNYEDFTNFGLESYLRSEQDQNYNASLDLNRDEEIESKNTSWVGKTRDTANEVVYQTADGFFDFFEGIGDWIIGGLGEIGTWFGADDKWAKDAIEYDWSKDAATGVMKTVDVLNPLTLVDSAITGDWDAYTDWDYFGENSSRYGEELYENSLLGDNAFHQGVNQVANVIGNQLPNIALLLATQGGSAGATAGSLGSRVASTAGAVSKVGKVGSMVGFGLSAGGSAVEQALLEDADLSNAMVYGTLSGAVESATELIPFPGGNSFGGVGRAVKETFGKRLARGFIEEGTEEVISDLVNPIISMSYKGKEALDEYATPEFYAGLGQSFALGGISATFFGGIDVALTRKKLGGKLGYDYVANTKAIYDTKTELTELNNNKQDLVAENKDTSKIDKRISEATSKMEKYANDLSITIDKISKSENKDQIINKLSDFFVGEEGIKKDVDLNKSFEEFNARNLNTDFDYNAEATARLVGDITDRYGSTPRITYVDNLIENSNQKAYYDTKANEVFIDSSLENETASVLAHEYSHYLIDNIEDSSIDNVVNVMKKQKVYDKYSEIAKKSSRYQEALKKNDLERAKKIEKQETIAYYIEESNKTFNDANKTYLNDNILKALFSFKKRGNRKVDLTIINELRRIAVSSIQGKNLLKRFKTLLNKGVSIKEMAQGNKYFTEYEKNMLFVLTGKAEFNASIRNYTFENERKASENYDVFDMDIYGTEDEYFDADKYNYWEDDGKDDYMRYARKTIPELKKKIDDFFLLYNDYSDEKERNKATSLLLSEIHRTDLEDETKRKIFAYVNEQIIKASENKDNVNQKQEVQEIEDNIEERDAYLDQIKTIKNARKKVGEKWTSKQMETAYNFVKREIEESEGLSKQTKEDLLLELEVAVGNKTKEPVKPKTKKETKPKEKTTKIEVQEVVEEEKVKDNSEEILEKTKSLIDNYDSFIADDAPTEKFVEFYNEITKKEGGYQETIDNINASIDILHKNKSEEAENKEKILLSYLRNLTQHNKLVQENELRKAKEEKAKIEEEVVVVEEETASEETKNIEQIANIKNLSGFDISKHYEEFEDGQFKEMIEQFQLLEDDDDKIEALTAMAGSFYDYFTEVQIETEAVGYAVFKQENLDKMSNEALERYEEQLRYIGKHLNRFKKMYEQDEFFGDATLKSEYMNINEKYDDLAKTLTAFEDMIKETRDRKAKTEVERRKESQENNFNVVKDVLKTLKEEDIETLFPLSLKNEIYSMDDGVIEDKYTPIANTQMINFLKTSNNIDVQFDLEYDTINNGDHRSIWTFSPKTQETSAFSIFERIYTRQPIKGKGKRTSQVLNKKYRSLVINHIVYSEPVQLARSLASYLTKEIFTTEGIPVDRVLLRVKTTEKSPLMRALKSYGFTVQVMSSESKGYKYFGLSFDPFKLSSKKQLNKNNTVVYDPYDFKENENDLGSKEAKKQKKADKKAMTNFTVKGLEISENIIKKARLSFKRRATLTDYSRQSALDDAERHASVMNQIEQLKQDVKDAKELKILAEQEIKNVYKENSDIIKANKKLKKDYQDRKIRLEEKLKKKEQKEKEKLQVEIDEYNSKIDALKEEENARIEQRRALNEYVKKQIAEEKRLERKDKEENIIKYSTNVKYNALHIIDEVLNKSKKIDFSIGAKVDSESGALLFKTADFLTDTSIFTSEEVNTLKTLKALGVKDYDNAVDDILNGKIKIEAGDVNRNKETSIVKDIQNNLKRGDDKKSALIKALSRNPNWVDFQIKFTNDSAGFEKALIDNGFSKDLATALSYRFRSESSVVQDYIMNGIVVNNSIRGRSRSLVDVENNIQKVVDKIAKERNVKRKQDRAKIDSEVRIEFYEYMYNLLQSDSNKAYRVYLKSQIDLLYKKLNKNDNLKKLYGIKPDDPLTKEVFESLFTNINKFIKDENGLFDKLGLVNAMEDDRKAIEKFIISKDLDKIIDDKVEEINKKFESKPKTVKNAQKKENEIKNVHRTYLTKREAMKLIDFVIPDSLKESEIKSVYGRFIEVKTLQAVKENQSSEQVQNLKLALDRVEEYIPGFIDTILEQEENGKVWVEDYFNALKEIKSNKDRLKNGLTVNINGDFYIEEDKKRKQFYHDMEFIELNFRNFNDNEVKIRNEQLIEKYGDELANFKYALRDYLDKLQEFRVANHIITQEDYDAMQSFYPNYVPTFREHIKHDISNIHRGANVSNDIRAREGSSLLINDLISSISAQTYSSIHRANIQTTFESLYGLNSGETRKDSGIVFEEIEEVDKYESSIFNMEQLSDRIENTEQAIKDNNTAVFWVSKADGRHKITARLTDQVAQPIVSTYNRYLIEEFLPFSSTFQKITGTFKNLVTTWNPFFGLFRNVIRDTGDALLTTKNGSFKFVKNFGKAFYLMSKNSELFRLYLANGGQGSSYFSKEMPIASLVNEIKKRNSKTSKFNVLKHVETLNRMLETVNRFNEFILSYERLSGEKYYNGQTIDTIKLLQAMRDSAEITTDFSRGGTIAKSLNRTIVPFLNAGIQGFCKATNFVIKPRTSREYARLIAKLLLLGFGLEAINYLINMGNDDFEALPDYTKEQYFLIPIGNGNFFKLPRARMLGVVQSFFKNYFLDMGVDKSKTFSEATKQFLDTTSSNISPFNGDFGVRTIFAPITDVINNKTWYGQQIDTQSDLNKYAKDRYSAKTSKIAIMLGNLFNQSPKRIDYLLNQYTGVIGDILLPFTSESSNTSFTQGIQNFVASNLSINAITNSKYRSEFFEARDEYLKMANASDERASMAYSYLNRALNELNDLENELDLALTDEEIYTLYLTLNAGYKKAIENANMLYEKLQNIGVVDTSDKFAITEAYRQVFGSEYALSYYNASIKSKADNYVELGGDYDTFYQAYFTLRSLSTKKEAEQFMKTLGLGYIQRIYLFSLCGGDLNESDERLLERYLKSKGKN